MCRIVCLTMKSQKLSTSGHSSPIRDAVAALGATAPQIMAFGTFFAQGHDTGEHHHDRAQFVHAERGLLQVWTEEGQWSVARCSVVTVPVLLKHLIVHLKEHPAGARSDRLAAVIADELMELVSADLHLPIPSDTRAASVALAMIDDPSDERGLDGWARMAGASGRTLTRLFLSETGYSFAEWRQRCRLLAALEMLAAGRPVTLVALDCGYRSPSAFSAAFTKVFGASPRQYMGLNKKKSE